MGKEWAITDDTVLESIGPWSEVKLEILKEYARAYSTILSAQDRPSFKHIYIDAFAGAGTFVSRERGELVPGSPSNAIGTDPPFKEFHFIDIDDLKVSSLESIAAGRSDVFVYRGDANTVLREEILPRVRWERYERALCLLDPYGMHYEWDVVQSIGQSKAIEVFFNFPIMDLNRNVLRRDPEHIDGDQLERMQRFWGDESWRVSFYQSRTQLDLFRGVTEHKAVTNQMVVDAYQQRLRDVAGFAYVPTSLPMRNAMNADVYHLLFAAQRPVATMIVEQIFAKYRRLGERSGE